MKVLWRQLVMFIFYGICLFTAFIVGTYWGIKNHSQKLTTEDKYILNSVFQRNRSSSTVTTDNAEASQYLSTLKIQSDTKN